MDLDAVSIFWEFFKITVLGFLKSWYYLIYMSIKDFSFLISFEVLLSESDTSDCSNSPNLSKWCVKVIAYYYLAVIMRMLNMYICKKEKEYPFLKCFR